MRTRILLTLWTVFFALHMVCAQNNRHCGFSPDKYKADLEKYIIQSTGMTPLDAKNFFPLFWDLHEKQRSINHEIQRMKKRTRKESLTDKECYILIKNISDLKIESAELEKSYYKKMCKVVAPKKVHAVMLAEDRFHRRMLQSFPKPRLVKLLPAK